MNPIMMSMMVKTKQAEINQEAKKHRVTNESIQSNNRRKSMQRLPISLATIGVIILLVMWAIVAV